MSRASGRSEQYRQARAFADDLQTQDDLDLAAAAYIDRYPKHPPGPFYWSKRKCRADATAALTGSGWCARLFSVQDQPHFASLRHHHIDVPKEYADPRLLYDRETVAIWVNGLMTHLEPPFWWSLEAGDRSIHAHALTSKPIKLAHLAPSKVIQPIYDPVGILAYLLKPNAVYTAVNLATRWRAERSKTGNLPRLSSPVGIPNARTFRPLEA